MNINAVLSLAPQLAEAVQAKDEHRALILAADLKAACEEPQTFRAWTPHCPRNACPEYQPGAAT